MNNQIALSADTIDVMFNLLYKQPWFIDMLSTFFQDTDDRNEFRQYVSEAILLKPAQEMIGLYNRGEMRFWLSRIFTNNIKSNSSIWHRKFRNPNEISTDFAYQDGKPIDIKDESQHPPLEPELDEDDKVLAIKKSISRIIQDKPRLKPYLRLFWLHYEQKWTMTKISKETGVSYKATTENIRLIKELIKEDLRTQHPNND
jgi:uncharacterized membrane protein YheB (UPF0754 family)